LGVDDTSRIRSTASVRLFGRFFYRTWHVSRRAWQTLTEALLPRMEAYRVRTREEDRSNRVGMDPSGSIGSCWFLWLLEPVVAPKSFLPLMLALVTSFGRRGWTGTY